MVDIDFDGEGEGERKGAGFALKSVLKATTFENACFGGCEKG